MKTLYIDCGMGAAGDMLTAALYELLDDKEKTLFLEKMNSLGIPNVNIEAEKSEKCGIVGTHMRVFVGGEEEETEDISFDPPHHDHERHTHDDYHDHLHNHHDISHEHHGMQEIEHIISNLLVSDRVKENVLSIYKLIAEAESNVHGEPVSKIHFHEVGSMDAIADVTAVCLLIEMINPEKIIASFVHVGSGQVRCAHGILPVPAPATAYILRDVPIYSKEIKGELCTPTGAALLKHFVQTFSEMPPIKVQKIGYGMGKKDFPVANCVRVLLGETVGNTDQVVELSCNVDDMTPERIGFAMEIIFDAGALEVYTVPVGMKKSRPGTLLCVMCREDNRDEIVRLIFKHTTTIGLRENVSRRYTLNRTVETRETSLGPVRIKRSEGYGVSKEKYEYEDLSKIAKDNDLSVEEVIDIISQ